MDHPCLEFISACGCCDIYGELVESLALRYEGRVGVKVYKVGKDFDYLPKYGDVTKSVLIINEKKAITQFSKSVVQGAFEEALSSATS
jgi:hypothetical protein